MNTPAGSAISDFDGLPFLDRDELARVASHPDSTLRSACMAYRILWLLDRQAEVAKLASTRAEGHRRSQDQVDVLDEVLRGEFGDPLPDEGPCQMAVRKLREQAREILRLRELRRPSTERSTAKPPRSRRERP